MPGLIRNGFDEENKRNLEEMKSTDLIVQYNKQRYGPEENHIIICYFYDEYDSSYRRNTKTKKYILKVNEILPVDSFADETGGSVQDFNNDYKNPLEHIKESVDTLINLPSKYRVDTKMA